MARFIDELKRTHSCGALRASDIGKEVVLFGWVANRRDHGSIAFIDLRDREGVTQIVFDPDASAEAHKVAEALRGEWVIGIRGKVKSRGEQFSKKENKMVSAANPNIPTGEIEITVLEAAVFNKAETPPFAIEDKSDTREEVRLEYRYLDLRRGPLHRALRMRHNVNQATRNYLTSQGCMEIETPFLVKYTPGGARNFLVPSRLHAQKFYALAESPQLFKQLFMVAGYDRYFQIVRCFRDEDLRIDRQPEFTQIDIEMSFVNQQDVFNLVEGLIFAIWKAALNVDLKDIYPDGHFPHLDFEESMTKYGNDKPDLRFGLPHTDLTDLVVLHGGGGIPFFTPIAEKFTSGSYRRDLPTEIVKAMVVPASANFSRTDQEKLEQQAKGMGAGGLARAKVGPDGIWVQSPLAKSATPEFMKAVNAAVGASENDLLLFQFGKTSQVHTVMANLRVIVANRPGLPLLAADLRLAAGGALDPSDRAGLATMTADLATRGTATRSATEISRQVESLGASLGAGASADASDVTMLTRSDKAKEIFAVLADEQAVRAFVPDAAAIATLTPLCFGITARGESHDFVSRYFAPSAGIPEDPVTGSIHATLVPYWARELGKARLEAFQASARGGHLSCEMAGDRVLITGKAVTFMKAEIHLPD